MSKIVFFLSRIGKLWQEKTNQQVIRYVIIIIVFEIGYLVFRFNSLPPQVPLFFSLPWGEKQLASASSLFVLPGFTILVTFFNYFIAALIPQSQFFFRRLLIIFSLIFSLITAISLIQITRLIL